MVRLSEVSPETVFNACYALLAEGKNPSFPSVYERIGRKGGSKVVQGYISEWRHSVAGKLASRTRAGVPDRIVRATDDLADAIWNEAIASVDAIVESRRQEIEAEAADMRAAAAQVEAVARSQVADLTGRLTANEKALALATQRVHGLDDVLRDRESHLVARDQTIAHQLTVMAEKDAERRLLQAEIDRREEERRDLLKKVERARKDATYLEVANSGLNSSLTEARVLVNGLRMELENVRSLHNKAHGEVEALSARLSESADALKNVKNELKGVRHHAEQSEASRQDLLRRAEVAEATVAAMRAERVKTRPAPRKKPKPVPPRPLR